MYRQYISQLRRACSSSRFKLIKIGYAGNDSGYPLFMVVLNDNIRRTVCFSAGIHGDETSGPYAALKYINQFKSTRVRAIIFPVANPFGFDKHLRYNGRRRDLNRRFFDRPLLDENRLLYSVAKKQQAYFFTSLHETSVKRSFYIYGYYYHTGIYSRLLDIARYYGPILKARKIDNNHVQDGLILRPKFDGSFEERMYKDGVPFSSCIEVPTGLSLARKVNCLVKMMNAITEYSSP